MKELSELHNRINILSSCAAENTESNTAHIENKKNDSSYQSNSQEHKLYNKFTLHKQYTRENRLSLSRRTSKEEFHSKILSVESREKIAITELYSRDLKLQQEHR